MVTGYVLSENDRVALARTVAKAGGTPLAARKLDPRHRFEDADHEYDGYFAVVDASETAEDGTRALKIRVIDGADSAAANCGSAWVNGYPFVVTAATMDVPSGDGMRFLYLKSTLDSGANPPAPKMPELELRTGRAAAEADVGRVLLATVEVARGSLIVRRQSYGEPQIIIWGDC
ncbi:MAG: hypothetical protein HPZ91_19090 [Lentisphaeria bacterium]|nr:hypothetical protein [Lentisphaeria bacterium]